MSIQRKTQEKNAEGWIKKENEKVDEEKESNTKEDQERMIRGDQKEGGRGAMRFFCQ